MIMPGSAGVTNGVSQQKHKSNTSAKQNLKNWYEKYLLPL